MGTKSNKSASRIGRQAIVLLSGGLDSAVTLYLARAKGYKCSCLLFDYGQRHYREMECAKRIARSAGASVEVIRIKLPKQGSVLLSKGKLPAAAEKTPGKIPSTYVPARNIIFLSFALSYAEAAGAESIFIGAHAQDYSGYPDCRPEFYRAFRLMSALGTKSGVENKPVKIVTPLINKNKAEIIKLGIELDVPLGLTYSCYRGTKRPCGKCDSCFFRRKGFSEAGLDDPSLK